MRSEEVFLPFPGGHARRDLVPGTSHVKGTWLGSEMHSLQIGGHLEAYMQRLAPDHRDTMRHSVARDWHPVSVLHAHYQACDGLGFTTAEMLAFGETSARHAQGTVLALTARIAASTAATPWTMLAQLQRFWDRFMRGGGVGVWRLGPKEARVEVVGFPGCAYRFGATGTRGVVQSALSLFCTRLHATEIPALASPTCMGIRLAWA